MKVGDYVRFKDKRGNTYIRKVIDGYKAHWYGCKVDKEANNVPYVSAKNIIKSSPNIIDLIEVGDYVNGEQVSRIKQCPEYHLGDGILIFNEHNETIYSNFRTSKYYDIKSIVTKESMERVTYYVK